MDACVGKEILSKVAIQRKLFIRIADMNKNQENSELSLIKTKKEKSYFLKYHF